MIPALLVRELLPLPQGAAETNARLPWANGSILSGEFEAGNDGTNGTLMLAGRRMLVQMPPNMPQGEIWVQLLDRNMPARFRFLSRAQAEAAVVRMLQKMLSSPATQQTDSTHGSGRTDAAHDTQQAATSHAPGSVSLEQSDAPYRFLPVGMSPPRWLLVDEREESTRGMLRAEADARGFQLRGRLDLPNLGALAFTLKDAGTGMRLNLFSGSRDGYRTLQSDFAEWLRQRETGLDGSLHMGLPDEEGGGGSSLRYS